MTTAIPFCAEVYPVPGLVSVMLPMFDPPIAEVAAAWMHVVPLIVHGGGSSVTNGALAYPLPGFVRVSEPTPPVVPVENVNEVSCIREYVLVAAPPFPAG